MRTESDLIKDLESLLARYGVKLNQPIRNVDEAITLAEKAMRWARGKCDQLPQHVRISDR